MYDLIIIGSGIGGLAGALYAGRYNLKTLVVQGEFGGETAKAGPILNYPGVKKIDGYDLMKIVKEQATQVGTELKSGQVSSIKKEGNCFILKVGDEEIKAKAVISAVGAEARRLGLPNEESLTGRGVHYCVTCDGPIYSGKSLAIVGGGDSAVKAVLLSSAYAEKIYLIVRGKKLRAEPINFENMKKLGDKVEVLYETEVKEIVGKDKLEKLVLSKDYNGSKDFVVDGMFIQIGNKPQTKLAASLGVELDEYKYIKVDNEMATNIAGFYAIGDTSNFFGRFKQCITAAAMGAVGATSVYSYVSENKDLCTEHQT